MKENKRFDKILKISFVSYWLVLIASPYITARTWADNIFILFIVSCGYQLAYIFFLRKIDEVSFLRTVANIFLYLSFALVSYFIWFYIDIFFNGINSGFFGATMYYGIEAWRSSGLISILFIPAFIFCLIYQICYFKSNKK